MSGESRFANSEGARNLVVAIGDRPAVADSRGRVRILDEPAADFVAARGIRQMVWVGRTLAIVHADGVVEAGVAASWMAPVQAQVAIGFCGHVVGAGDRFLVAMDASTGKVVARFLAAAPVVALAADGDLLVMGHADGTAVVLERSAFMAAVAGQRGC